MCGLRRYAYYADLSLDDDSLTNVCHKSQGRRKRTLPSPKENPLENLSGLKTDISRPVVDTKPYKNEGSHVYHRKSSSVAPFLSKKKVPHWSRVVYGFCFSQKSIANLRFAKSVFSNLRFLARMTDMTQVMKTICLNSDSCYWRGKNFGHSDLDCFTRTEVQNTVFPYFSGEKRPDFRRKRASYEPLLTPKFFPL